MKDSTAGVRVESDVKSEAEDILQKPGMPASAVISSPCRQVIYRRGVPFPLAMPREPKTIGVLSDAELDAKFQRSYAQAAAGEGRPMADVFEDLGKDLR